MAESMFGPQYQADQTSIDRRRKMAQMLVQQALTPQQGQMAGRIYVPPGPLSAVSRVAQAYFGGKGLTKADEDERALGDQYSGDLAKEVQRIAAMRQGTAPTMDAADNVEQPGVPGDPRAAVTAALTSQFAPVRKMGELDFQGQLRSSENALNRAAVMEQKAMALEQRAEDKALDRESRERMAEEARALRLQIAQLTKAAGGRSPYFTPIYTPKGVMSFNTREGTAAPVTVDGQPIVRATDDPQRQGEIAGARTSAEAQAKRTFNMQGIGAVIKEAEDILEGTVKPTGSGLGSAVDAVGGFFGISPTGAKEAQQLKAVAGALTAKMPRMEGPQSDKDVQLYRESAAEIGNDTVPVERRKSALQVVKNLWLKYEKQNPEGFSAAPQNKAPAKAPEGVPPEVWNAMTPEEKALWR